MHSASRPGASDALALTVTFWGTRGSIPSPGAAMGRYGGNTACLEVRASNGQLCILDAGTGIRALGLLLQADPEPNDVDLLLTHFHWDHIQGLPFFAPASGSDFRVRIHAPAQERSTPAELLAAQMGEPFFPVRFDDLTGIKGVVGHDSGEWTIGSFSVCAMRVCHPSPTFGYRVRSGGATLVYIPDNEIGLLRERGGAAYQELVAFCSGADLLVHDAMYTTGEYAAKVGWGHSTFSEAVALAREAGVTKLRLFHHHPERTDTDLERIVSRLGEEALGDGAMIEIAAATEGERVDLPARASA